jgi:hypothetical protein
MSTHGLPREVFLSHATSDRKFADRLAELFAAHSIPFWYSRRNIVGAQQWHDEIGDALARCDWFLLLLSPRSVKSEWVKRELLYALNQPRYRNRIILCMVKPCDPDRLPWTLSSTFQIIYMQPDLDSGLRELMRVWSLAYRPPVRKSPKRSAK